MENRRLNTLSEECLLEQIQNIYTAFHFKNKKLLVIIPDNTRTAPIGTFFKLFYKVLGKSVKRLDYLIALGTHPLLSEEDKLRRVGIDKREKESIYKNINIVNHRWDKEETFAKIGTINNHEVEELTGGLLHESTDISINRMIFDYDTLLILGPVFPHEIAGFSGSNKYLFPGICGWNFTDTTHWLSALRTNLKTIGIKNTPARRLIDRAAELVQVPIVYFNLVVDNEGLKGLFVGSDRSAWNKAVELSAQLNIKYVHKRYKTVLSIPSRKYDDFWTGAKAFYKIEPIVEDGGEIIVFAPCIEEISITHSHVIEQIGFHIKDYFVTHMNRYRDFPKAVLAYSALVKGTGIYQKGSEKPRITIILSSAVSEEMCKKMNIAYRDPGEINIHEWENRENEGIKVIHNSGEVLYKVNKE